ncbi:MAG: anhydro-N-acetylmuramic acid kinase [Methylococcales bacterium]|nr:anhydro-N-acetylmuramic acid kinase [Methylococcales bacterium]
MSEFYIGLISGTSMDGIDAALLDFSHDKATLQAFFYQPFPAELREKIHAISQAGQKILLTDYGALDTLLGHLFAEAALSLLAAAQIPAERILAIGSHGQTVYHAPEPPTPFTLQIGDPNIIAQRTGITTVADFRRRDIAAGGQGAPMVPAFHQAVFATDRQLRTIVNIGGIANITVLDDKVAGFDTGPGNALLDIWHQQHRQQAYDDNGDWAGSGQVQAALLAALKDDPYFDLPAPKSTGREYFSAPWLLQKLNPFPAIKAEDVQATLCQLTADSIAEAIHRYAPRSEQILVCGGGAHNGQLMRLLAKNMRCPVLSTAELGMDPDHVEACAFAWLARQTLNNLPGNLCSVTGAAAPVTLGGIYPGKSGLSG